MSRHAGRPMAGPGQFRSRRRPPELERVVIVGGGRAGLSAAEELRYQGYAGEIDILCDEPHAPYDRPACSKSIISGKQRPADVVLPMRAGTDARWRLGRKAVHLDPEARVVYADTDEEFPYDGLVIATGAHSVVPAGWPVGEPGFRSLHTLADAWALRHDLRTAKRVAIVGGGLTGSEAACTVRNLARECVLIDSNRGVMTRAIGDIASTYVTEHLVREGVQLRLGRRVKGVDRSRRGWVLKLDDGSEEYADVVIATLGERPHLDWLKARTQWDLSDGILCDDSLRVVGAQGVVAAGTVARWPNRRYDEKAARCGQWIAALEQGQFAARTLLAGEYESPPAVVLPRYWSDQFGLKLQVCGQMPPDAQVSVTRMRPHRRDVARAGVAVSYVRDGMLVGLVAVNAPLAFTQVTRAMLATPTIHQVPAETVLPTIAERHLTAVA